MEITPQEPTATPTDTSSTMQLTPVLIATFKVAIHIKEYGAMEPRCINPAVARVMPEKATIGMSQPPRVHPPKANFS
jgi:hypothetical protein